VIGDVRQVRSRPWPDRLGADRHGAGTTLVLHLAPGVVFAAAAFPLARLAADHDLPAAFGLQAATLLVLVPVQLGTIALAARRRTGSWRLRGALPYRSDRSPRLLLALGAVTLVWAGATFALTAPVAEGLRSSLFAWWPAELDYAGHLTDPSPRSLRIAAWASGLVATTLVAPVVEELYFRGFLLPRLDHLGGWASLVNTVLFAAYHVWSPWQAPTRVVAMLPLFHATWRTRSVALAIGVHVALNLIGDTLASLPVVFR
jgi:membrane protease YdiL (CAAX protease family)